MWAGHIQHNTQRENPNAQQGVRLTQLILILLPHLLPPLPRAHYKEYLVSLINAHSLDPATLYDVEELETATVRYLHVHPQAAEGEDRPAYQARLLQVMLSALHLTSTPTFHKSPATPIFLLQVFSTIILSFTEADRRDSLGKEHHP